MKRLVIFGAGQIAEVAHFYFSRDSTYDVVAFTVDAAYLEQDKFCGLPVVAFEHLEKSYPPDDCAVFVALSYARLNGLRKDKYLEVKNRGYRVASYLSSRATVWEGFELGENCLILEDNTLQPFVQVGNNVTLWSGNHIGHHARIADHCFLASHIVVSGGVSIGEQCFIGVNATLRDHVRIGERCVIGAGALVLADAEPEGVYSASPTERSRVPSSRLRKI
jgi:sugar O-acyltransferase (sialic acid O-acetyltransferase NeuD family)